MKVALGADHAGYHLKEIIKSHLVERGYDVHDFGTDSDQAVDYPDVIYPASRSVATGECHLGIVFGGSGNGEAIVANKVSGIRCAVCWSRDSARLAKEHNNANMISIGARMIQESEGVAIVDAWIDAMFEGGRHERRIQKIEEVMKMNININT